MNRPRASSNGPPLLPGLMAASVCTRPRIMRPVTPHISRPKPPTRETGEPGGRWCGCGNIILYLILYIILHSLCYIISYHIILYCIIYIMLCIYVYIHHTTLRLSICVYVYMSLATWPPCHPGHTKWLGLFPHFVLWLSHWIFRGQRYIYMLVSLNIFKYSMGRIIPYMPYMTWKIKKMFQTTNQSWNI